MSLCKYYHIERQHLECREIRADGQRNIQAVEIPWCSHKHSPAPQRMTGTIGSAHRLQCKGELAKCQVHSDKLADAVP
jgi:hypothetical protein